MEHSVNREAEVAIPQQIRYPELIARVRVIGDQPRCLPDCALGEPEASLLGELADLKRIRTLR